MISIHVPVHLGSLVLTVKLVSTISTYPVEPFEELILVVMVTWSTYEM